MFLALHRSLVDAPFFPARPAPTEAAAAAVAAIAALAEPVAVATAEAGAAHHYSSRPSSSSSLVSLAGGLAACVATDSCTRCAEADAPPVLRAAALVVGAFDNELEVCREYCLELETGNPSEDDLAAMVLDLYGKNFEDESGDSSDEPAALLGMMKGSWAIALVSERPRPRSIADGGRGTEMGLHVIVARSSGRPSSPGRGNGVGDEEMQEEDDQEEEEDGTPLPPPPLYWGSSNDCLVISSTPQPGLSPFPAGCFYESSSSPSASSVASAEGEAGERRGYRIDQFSRTAASAKTREVVVVAAASGGNGGGNDGSGCGLGYKTKSGKNLVVE